MDLVPWEGFEIATSVASSNSQPALASSVGPHAVSEGSRGTPTLPNFSHLQQSLFLTPPISPTENAFSRVLRPNSPKSTLFNATHQGLQ